MGCCCCFVMGYMCVCFLYMFCIFYFFIIIFLFRDCVIKYVGWGVLGGETEAPSGVAEWGVFGVGVGVVAEVLGVALSWVYLEYSRSVWERWKRRRRG